jgi:galactokinase
MDSPQLNNIQCKEAVEAIKKLAEIDVATATTPASITHLRDVTPEMVQSAFDSGAISEVVYKRAKHGTSEDRRTLKAAEALVDSDYATVGELMKQVCELQQWYCVEMVSSSVISCWIYASINP